MRYNQGPQIQTLPLTPVVKKLIIACVGIWFFLQVIAEQFLFPNLSLSYYFGFVVENVFTQFFVWQFVSYMFLHDTQGVMHLVFNMLSLWWIGSELEILWGSRKFLFYYLMCGIGAALIYFVGSLGYYVVTDHYAPLQVPVVGASGGIFGLLLAYGILFGDRVIHFMFLFPMKAKFFILLIGAIEIVMLLNQGVGSGKVANLAHLGGIFVGFLYLVVWTRLKKSGFGTSNKTNKKNKLKLVVNNEKPKYWN
jgi:membrane associated rhomboid family serine protease